MKPQTKVYIKHHSFKDFYSNFKSDVDQARQRVLRCLESSSDTKIQAIIDSAKKDLSAPSESVDFKITEHIVDELSKIDDAQVGRYIFHRYRYDVFPKQKKLDDYPPYLQIEPTSVCNYRCVFCYQTDEEFTTKSKGFMGAMSFDLFKEIIDQVLGKVEFFSLASRGEPLLCKDIDRMLEYCSGKFLGLKINTNASMLNEKHIHAILSGGVNTVVFSADAAKEPLYSQLRVKGNLEKVLTNIRLFQSIRSKQYPKSKVITRVSGVKFGEDQDMDSMIGLWGELVDQVSFVAYNPWENVYQSHVNTVTTPCSDLWRRMFVWFDGSVNPCDTDFKSMLSPGKIQNGNVSSLWLSEGYQKLREAHLKTQRSSREPCRRCTVV